MARPHDVADAGTDRGDTACAGSIASDTRHARPHSVADAGTERGDMATEWKIRSMDEATSRSAVAAAERAKVTTAVWVGAAIREKIAREREEVTGEVMQPEASAPPPRGDELGELAQLARTLTPPDKDSEAMRLARTMVWSRLKALQKAAGGEARPARSPAQIAARPPRSPAQIAGPQEAAAGATAETLPDPAPEARDAA